MKDLFMVSIMDYNPIASDYDKVEGEDKTLFRLGYCVLADILTPHANREILDYGCGTGMFARMMRDLGARMTGVDVSEGMIRIARQTDPAGISYFRIRSGDLAMFPDRSFDKAVSNFVFCAIPEKKEIRMILAGIFRVLKENGIFIMMNSHWEASNGREFVHHRLEYCEKLVSGERIRVITKSDPPIIFEDFFRPVSEYAGLLEEAGFSVESVAEPIITSDEPGWKDENKYPPYYLIKGRKKS